MNVSEVVVDDGVNAVGGGRAGVEIEVTVGASSTGRAEAVFQEGVGAFDG